MGHFRMGTPVNVLEGAGEPPFLCIPRLGTSLPTWCTLACATWRPTGTLPRCHSSHIQPSYGGTLLGDVVGLSLAGGIPGVTRLWGRGCQTQVWAGYDGIVVAIGLVLSEFFASSVKAVLALNFQLLDSLIGCKRYYSMLFGITSLSTCQHAHALPLSLQCWGIRVWERKHWLGICIHVATCNCICETPVLNIELFEYLHSSQIANLQMVDPYCVIKSIYAPLNVCIANVVCVVWVGLGKVCYHNRLHHGDSPVLCHCAHLLHQNPFLRVN